MIQDPHFSLDLESPWAEERGENLEQYRPEQYRFVDEARNVFLTVSSMSVDLAADQVSAFAEVLVSMRMDAERAAARAFGRQFLIYEPIIVPQSWGDAIAYYGHDTIGREFSYSGSITTKSVINIYMETGLLSEHELACAMDEVLSQVEFDRPPLGRELNLH